MGAARYVSEFQSSAGNYYKVVIWDDDYASASASFNLGADGLAGGFQLQYEGQTDQPFGPVVPSRLDFDFMVEDQDGEDFIIDCATGEPDRFKIYVLRGTSDPATDLYWQGFVQGEGITIDDNYFPYAVRLTAGDLKFLEDIEYSNAGSPITGSQTIAELMLGGVYDFAGHRDFVLDSVTPDDAVFKHNVNWFGKDMATGGDPINLTRLDGRTFYSFNRSNEYNFTDCFDVLEQISMMLGCRSFQSAGTMWMQQIDDLVNANSTVYEWEFAGKTLTASGSSDLAVDIDRVSHFMGGGGSTSFIPGAKRAVRKVSFGRNFLDGLSAETGSPISVNLGNIPLMTKWVSNSEAPQFAVKFQITYKFTTKPQYDHSGSGNMDNRSGELIGVVPVWNMKLYGTGDDDGSDWYYRNWYKLTGLATDYPGSTLTEKIEGEAPSIYKERLANCSAQSISGNINVRRAWQENPTPQTYQIFDTEEYKWADDPDADGFSGERTITVELAIPNFANGSTYNNVNNGFTIQGVEGLTFEIDLHGYYNRWFTEWRTSSPETELDWKIDQLELYVFGDETEKDVEGGSDITAENTTTNRREIDLKQSIIPSFDERTWHIPEVWDGSAYVNSPLWYRGQGNNNISFWTILDQLPVFEVLAMQARGVRLYQGSIITVDGLPPDFHNVITKDGRRYLPIQGTFDANSDTWTNIALMELARDTSGITMTRDVGDSAGAGYSTNGGGSAGISGGSGGGSGGGVALPIYESATGQSGSTYTPANFDPAIFSAYTDDEVNQSMMVFVDATKLRHGDGYTVTGSDLSFTDALDSSTIEIYVYE